MDARDETFLLPTTTKEEEEMIIEMIGVDLDDSICRGMLLVEWTYSQPHLPIEKESFYRYCAFIGRLLVRKKMRMERTKQLIDAYYTMKSLAPEYLLNRDPANKQLRASMEHCHIVPMPMLTDRLTRVCVVKIRDKTFSPHMMSDWNKYAMMVGDILQREDLSYGEDIVMDMANMTLQHVAVTTPAVIKKMAVCFLSAFALKPSSFHFVNAPTYAEIMLSLAKSMLKPKLANRFFVHVQRGYKSLHDYIPPKYLPKDLDGEGPAMKDIQEAWLKKIDSYREWFLEQENYVVQENLRPGKPISHSDIFGMEGSFQQLSFD